MFYLQSISAFQTLLYVTPWRVRILKSVSQKVCKHLRILGLAWIRENVVEYKSYLNILKQFHRNPFCVGLES